jgi:hypothetical protein
MIEAEVIALSILAGLIITVIVLIIPAWLYKKTGGGFSIMDLIREAGWPSLARFQFLAWTLVVVFCLATICSVRFLSGNLEIPSQIPENLLALIGVSAGVTATSSFVSKNKYGEQTKKLDKVEYKEFIKDKKLGTMLLENDAPSLTRFQMFAWTGLSIFLYLAKFLGTLNQFTIATVETLALPDIETTLLVLMGVSQGAYIGGKWVSPSVAKVFNAIYDSTTKTVIVNGINFGESKKAIKLDTETIAENQITTWDKELIRFNLKTALTAGPHNITIIIGAKEVKHEFAV